MISTEQRNRFGQPAGYTLYPEASPVLLADPGSSVPARAGFATNHLWVTRYHPSQRYPAGDYVNQHPGGAGVPRFVAGDQDIDGQDIVVWHTFGPAHFPRPEDWPVMPVSPVRVHAQADRLLRPQPDAGRAAVGGAHCSSAPGSPA